MSSLNTHKISRLLEMALHGVISSMIVAVLLIPFRYIQLPDFSPRIFSIAFRYIPLGLSILALVLWLCWRKFVLVKGLGKEQLCAIVMIFSLVCVLSGIAAATPVLSLSKSGYYILTGMMLFLISFDFYQQASHRFSSLIVLIPSSILSFYGIFEFVSETSPIYGSVFSTDNPVYLKLSPDPWFGRRIRSSIGHPVFLGASLAMVLPLAIVQLGQANKGLKQGLWKLGVVGIAAALVLTFSRGAWLAGIVGVVVLWWLQGARLKWQWLVGVGILGILLVNLGGFMNLLIDRIADVYTQYLLNFSGTTRGQSMGFVAQMVEKNPLLGTGTGMYRFEVYEMWQATNVRFVLDSPDNMYLIWFAEHGILGFALACLLLVTVFEVFYQKSTDALTAKQREQAQASCGCLASACIAMLTCSLFYFPALRIEFWLLLGGLMANCKRGREEVEYGDLG